ncbi:hypothetical protein FBQ87_09385 [Sphingobacteriales bacterium CHB3]|nr:hypothetical protein [Sphingobacteriales bacterium CHB3]
MIYEDVLRLAEECAAKHSAHVVDVSVRGSQHKTVLEIFVDAESGVTTELCSGISRELGVLLDERNIVKGSYQLVVSSPGIDRGLKFPWQYKKHVGRKLRLRTAAGLHTGKLVATNDEELVMEIEKEAVPFRFDAIQEATVQAPW